MDDDVSLLTAWKAGDRRAGTRLFERYYPALARYFRNKLSVGAEDLIQQTFTGCVEGLERVRSSATFRSYVFGVAHHVLCAHLRRRAREPVDLETVSIQDLAPGPSSIHARQEEQRLLLEALRRIPVTHQAVLELHYWEQLSSEEMADVLGIPAPTARGRLMRARELLRESLAALTDSPEHLRSTVTRLEHWAAQLRARLDGG
ncbi:sigma-70 family RNA polymerase sigma factor [Myxococcus sp. AM011]|uniref:RNA polymerase sigma factor n=1 Tax=Myxococcus sp. AM011 TaxID=2745200 RepID=UPI0015958905|nr:sigma-70 family RNA polymerase sigma factor [Myxococcus sp. AM011]NVJ22001.1 sigma-70 family RNA polymerase sigma factor [Myxococcus sp. AM011]